MLCNISQLRSNGQEGKLASLDGQFSELNLIKEPISRQVYIHTEKVWEYSSVPSEISRPCLPTAEKWNNGQGLKMQMEGGESPISLLKEVINIWSFST